MNTGLIGSYNSGSGVIDLLYSSYPSATDEVLAFHYGNFDNHYGDGTVGAAAANGRVYADTAPETLPAKFGSIGTPSTASGQTTYSWTPPTTSLQANVLVVAGGGGGGFDGAGGGGGGGVIFQTGIAISGTQTIKVGNGGSRGTTINTVAENGFNSSALGFTSSGGGGGGGKQSNGGNGANGGGGGHPAGYTGGTGTTGGNGGSSSADSGGGGGGAGGANGENGGTAKGGNGGYGFLASVFGETYGESGWFGGGGGGGTYNTGTGGRGGAGGGGAGGDRTLVGYGEDGERHTGGGGGSNGNTGTSLIAGNGGSGIVAIRYIVDNNVILSDYVVTRNLAVVLDASSYSGTGTTWSDISGNGRNATIQGTVPWVNDGFTSYFDFSGANADYIKQTAGTTQIYKDMCIVFQHEDSDWNYLLASSTTSDKSLRIYGNTISNPGNVGDWAQSATTYYVNGVADTDAVALSQNQWYILGGENKNASLLASAWNYHIGTGYTQGSRNLNGKIAFLALYTEPLTAAEHIHNYNALKHRFGV